MKKLLFLLVLLLPSFSFEQTWQLRDKGNNVVSSGTASQMTVPIPASFLSTTSIQGSLFTGGAVFISTITSTPDVAQNWLNLGNDVNGNGGSLVLTSIGSSPGVGIISFNAAGSLTNPSGFFSGFITYFIAPEYSDGAGKVQGGVGNTSEEFVAASSMVAVGSPIPPGPAATGWSLTTVNQYGNPVNDITVSTGGLVGIGPNFTTVYPGFFGPQYILPTHQLQVNGDIFSNFSMTATAVLSNSFYVNGTEAFSQPFIFPDHFNFSSTALLTSGTTGYISVSQSSRTVAALSGYIIASGTGGTGDSIVCHGSQGSITITFAAGAAVGTQLSNTSGFSQPMSSSVYCYIQSSATALPKIEASLEYKPQ